MGSREKGSNESLMKEGEKGKGQRLKLKSMR